MGATIWSSHTRFSHPIKVPMKSMIWQEIWPPLQKSEPYLWSLFGTCEFFSGLFFVKFRIFVCQEEGDLTFSVFENHANKNSQTSTVRPRAMKTWFSKFGIRRIFAFFIARQQGKWEFWTVFQSVFEEHTEGEFLNLIQKTQKIWKLV